MNEYIQSYHKTERIYTFKNGSILEFNSYSDEQDAKSGKRDILFANEANGIPWPIFRQLEMRTNEEIFIDYNPTEEFWAHERIMPRENAVTFYSNFTHNRYIDENVKHYILDLADEDLETWKVYGLGKTGTLAETIYRKHTEVPAMPDNLKKRAYALDFGYRAHPTALIECGLQNRNDIYLHELFYLHRMKANDIDLAMQAIGIGRRDKIFADSAEARLCDELTNRGWNIIPVEKGPDSVRYGIQLMQQYNMHITESSYNIINERKKYKWKTDPKTGQIMNEPVKAFDHALDAARYWAQKNLKPLRRIRSTFRTGTA